jgi:flagellar hook protein FlgE
MQISSVALGGLDSAEAQFNGAASKIAAAPASPDTVDLSSSAVSLLNAKDGYEANLKTLEVADDMTKQTLDLLG